MQTTQLNFLEFQAKLDAAFPEEPEAAPSRLERFSMYSMFAGITVALLATLFKATVPAAAYAILSGLVGEIIFGFLYLWLSSKRVLMGLSFSGIKNADELEQDFHGYVGITTWLRQFPEEHLQNRLIFVSNRAEGWQRGTALLWGGVEKLGILSVVVALYLQFKDVTLSWPPNVSVVGTILMVAVLAFYALGLWAYTKRVQASTFERFLRLALNPDFKLSELPRSATTEAFVD